MNRRSFLLLVPAIAVAARVTARPTFPGLVSGWDLGSDEYTATAVYRVAEDGKTYLVTYWDGGQQETAVWNRLLTDDEMRTLRDSTPYRWR